MPGLVHVGGGGGGGGGAMGVMSKPTPGKIQLKIKI